MQFFGTLIFIATGLVASAFAAPQATPCSETSVRHTAASRAVSGIQTGRGGYTTHRFQVVCCLNE
jgi:hypothetical protein